MRAAVSILPLILGACVAPKPPDHLMMLQQEATKISIDLSDGVSEIEAYKIASPYLAMACGVVSVPIEEKTEWRVEILAGLAGINTKTVFVDKKTGVCRIVDHTAKS